MFLISTMSPIFIGYSAFAIGSLVPQQGAAPFVIVLTIVYTLGVTFCIEQFGQRRGDVGYNWKQ